MKPVQILVATFRDQQAAIKSVRHRVFVKEQGIDPRLEWDDQDHHAVFALAMDETNCIGTGRLLPNGKIGRMAVLPEWRRSGIGSMLLNTLLAQAETMGLKTVTLSAQIQVCEFYKRHAFIAVGSPFIEAGIPHQEMLRNL